MARILQELEDADLHVKKEFARLVAAPETDPRNGIPEVRPARGFGLKGLYTAPFDDGFLLTR
ncbi:MAG: hypothetical protein ACRDJU_09190 [Actinomycetota bacterium]